MIYLLSLVLISFFITSLLLIPFINYLFSLRRNKKKSNPQATSLYSPIHNMILRGKDVNTPVGGGILLIFVIVILSAVSFYWMREQFNKEAYILIFTLLSFGFIGILDDLKKIFTNFNGKYAGLSAWVILVLQLFFGLIISLALFFTLGLNNIFIPIFGNVILGYVYIPLALLSIVSFANASNIADGLDGLCVGLLTICLLTFLVIAHSVFNTTLSVFVGIWIGSLIAYLYFNVFPARIYLGDAGAYGFGATLAVVGLLTGKIIALGVIGGVFVIIVLSSLLQILSKNFFKKKIFPVAPIHMYFKYIGWEEPKIVMRFWLVGAIFAILGLWLALLSR